MTSLEQTNVNIERRYAAFRAVLTGAEQELEVAQMKLKKIKRSVADGDPWMARHIPAIQNEIKRLEGLIEVQKGRIKAQFLDSEPVDHVQLRDDIFPEPSAESVIPKSLRGKKS